MQNVDDGPSPRSQLTSGISPSEADVGSRKCASTDEYVPSGAGGDPSAVSRLEAPTGRSLFLQGLRHAIEYPDLFRVFRRFGTVVSCRVLHDAKRGISRGIGYVNFSTSEAANRAVAELSAQEHEYLGGSNVGQPRSAEDGTGKEDPFLVKLADHDPHFTEDDARALSVHFIPTHITAEQVRQVFAEFGEVVCCELTSAAASKQSPPKSATADQLTHAGLVARVEFSDAAAATAAAASLHRSALFAPNRELYIKPAEPETKIRAREERKRAERGTPPGPRRLVPPAYVHQHHHQHQHQHQHQHHAHHVFAPTYGVAQQAVPPAYLTTQGQQIFMMAPPVTGPPPAYNFGSAGVQAQLHQVATPQQQQQPGLIPIQLAPPGATMHGGAFAAPGGLQWVLVAAPGQGMHAVPQQQHVLAQVPTGGDPTMYGAFAVPGHYATTTGPFS
jgi:hypothetical protein